VLLDEPSTGVDPQAKRFMWTIISNISTLRKQSTVVLTTHSMEEAEALCTKIGIMVDGEFRCYGSSQHIKNKYGTGFEIEVKIKQLTEDDLQGIKATHSIRNEVVTHKGLEALLKKVGFESMLPEISEKGLGAELHKLLETSGKLYIDEVLRWAHIEKNGRCIMDELRRKFAEFQLVEHYSNSYTFKVSRDRFSIGAVFGMIEELKRKFSIQEYSAQ
jgi:ATP-binding cassette, subfamily A (ABC1), member 3